MDSDSHQETGDGATAHEPEQYDSDVEMDGSVDASFMKTPTKRPRERLSTTEATPAPRAANAPLPNRQKRPVPHPDPDPTILPRTTTTRKRRVRHAIGTGRGTVLFPAADNLRSTERRVQLDLALLGSALRKVATAMEASTEALPEGDAKTIISGFMRDTVARMSQLLERGYSVTPNSDLPQLALPIRQSGRVPFQTSAPAVAVTASVSAAGRHTAAQPTNQHKRARLPLKALSVNVQNSGTSNDTALALGHQHEYDVIQVQEPYAAWLGGRQMLKTHPGFKTFAPPVPWTSQHDTPRAITYVRKGLRTYQLPIAHTRYAVWVVIQGVTFVNMYRSPRQSETLEALLRWSPSGPTVVTGDFNASHVTWQSGRQRALGNEIAEWACDHALQLLNTPDVPTHHQGGVLGLAFSNVAYAESDVNDLRETGSDHRTLDITIPLGMIRTCPTRKHILGPTAAEEQAFKTAVNTE